MKLFIIIPTHKRSRMLDDCISSIYTHDIAKGIGNKMFNIIIVSDCKDMDARNVVQKYSKYHNISYFEQRKPGPSASRNYAMRKTHATQNDIICFLDDDCVALSHWIKNIIKVHEGSDVAVVSGIQLPYDTGLISEFSHSLEASNILQLRHMQEYTPMLVNNTSYKAGILKGVRFNERLISGEDVDFNYNVWKHNLRMQEIKRQRIMKQNIMKQSIKRQSIKNHIVQKSADGDYHRCIFSDKIIVKHHFKARLSEFLGQQFRFGKGRQYIIRHDDDYPNDKKNKVRYFAWMIAVPFLSPFIRMFYAIKHNKRLWFMYLPLGYLQQFAYWTGFLSRVFRTD